MHIQTLIKPHVYYDSLVLMQLSTKLQGQPGVCLAFIMMGTEENKASLQQDEMLTEGVKLATSNDLFVVVGADTREASQAAIEFAVDYLDNWRAANRQVVLQYKSLDAAIRNTPAANLVSISLPGKYATAEARRALEADLHVFLFSDNVSLEHELELKRLAVSKRLLLMGPDCGTAILRGAALGFANAVRPGPVGIVGASGTGIQEVTSLIHCLGSGISQAFGAGSRDVSGEVGGITLKAGLEWLIRDNETQIIIIVSKPASDSVTQQVQDLIRRCDKPVVVNFLGHSTEPLSGQNILIAQTLEEAAWMAVALAGGGASLQASFSDQAELIRMAEREHARLHAEQCFFRGLFSGGTFAVESATLLVKHLHEVFGNISLPGVSRLEDPLRSVKNTVVDMGDDLFTVGKPHPMLAPSMRRERLLVEAADATTGVILLDIVLGYGVHPDPAGEFFSYIREAKELAAREGRHLPVVVNVCGVDEDPQNRRAQFEKLVSSGALVAPTNASATRLAIGILTGEFPIAPIPSVPPPVNLPESFSGEACLHLPDKINVINIGLSAFAEALKAQGVPVTEVDFRPPAGGQQALADLLWEML